MASDDTPLRAAIEVALADPTRRSDLVDAWVDAALRTPLNDVVTPALLRGLALEIVEPRRVSRFRRRHGEPAWERHRSWANVEGVTLGDLVDPGLQAQVEEALVRLDLKPPAWLEGAVNPALVRELLRPVVQDALVTFAKRLPLFSSGEDSRLLGMAERLRKGVEKRAQALREVSKNVMGSLGAEMDRRIEGVAKELSESILLDLRATVAARMASDEGQRILRELRLSVLDHLRRARLSDVLEDLERRRDPELEAIVDQHPKFHLTSEVVERLIEREVTEQLTVLAQGTLGQRLDDWELRSAAEPLLRSVARAQVEALLGGDAFTDWLVAFVDALPLREGP